MAANKPFQKQQEMTDEKRRKKHEEIKPDPDPTKLIILPQKKRVLPTQSGGSPARKNLKTFGATSSPQDESAADENLIRETEAALKSLSGSWSGHRGTIYKEESPPFENLFAEKKPCAKLSPTSSSTSSTDNSCSLKDVITLRDQHDESDKDGRPIKIKQEFIDTKADDCCQYKKSKIVKTEPAQYEPPDFNELVDDSSNELEIDMSEAASDKTESDEKSDRKKDDEDKRFSDESQQSVYHPFPRPSVSNSSPFSTTSAFRPPTQTTATKSLNPLGPYPAEATFVGYPQNIINQEDKNKPIVNLMQLKPTEPEVSITTVPVKISVAASPEAVSKQYTILQPASVSSRAASALQEAVREGIPTVSAVSSSSTTETKMTTPSMSMSPSSMGRGKWYSEFDVKNGSQLELAIYR